MGISVIEKSTPYKVNFRTLGCRVNHSESDSMARHLTELGYQIVSRKRPADITVINSCTVTKQAAAKTRGAVAAARRISPQGKIVLAGCYAQELKEALLKISGVDLVIGNQEKYQLDRYIETINKDEKKVYVSSWNGRKAAKCNASFPDYGDIPDGFRTRAFMKIQDGCDYYCAYCIIPYLRGPSRSRPLPDCLKEAQDLYEKGYKEIVLTGINVGDYKTEDNRNLADLLEGLLLETDIPRIRLSSIEPDLINPRIIELMQQEQRICRHFHIPLQHGTGKILTAMGRKYTPAFYQRLVSHIAGEIPGVSIGADVMVGFPGESDQYFNNMLTYLKELPVNYLHVFRYSKRCGTQAAKYRDTVSPTEKKERSAQIRELSRSKLRDFQHQYLAHEFKVLYEKQDREGCYWGYTDNYIKVKITGESRIMNQIRPTKLCKVIDEYSLGEIVSE